ncbi:MAG: autotransporter outer membrane beta-barrel domain-containing protein, partial [Phascolarctobacterium sp.]|nr:autotransporter outer membrane beta-barrel domain-containing protein [Phascolarctobacterium sp.]
NILGGDVTIKAATAGSNITLHTDSIGTSKQEEVKKVLDALAQKLTYINHTDGNLTGTVQILEGMTTSSAMRKGEIVFGTDGKGNLNTSKDIVVENTYTGDYIYGDSETAMMKGAKSAMASTVMMWRSESNDLLQRMGDVRLATEESGVWAKYYGGKYEMDAQNTNFSTNYKAYQVGYDKAVGNGWNVGVAVSHNEGDSRYDRGGEGEMTVTSLSVYGNKDYGDGRYLGLILKGSHLKNEYEVFNNDGYKLEGDFKTWGTSISAEYGKRIEKGNGFYFDPSVELTIGHVQGKDYTATSDMLAAYGKTATMQVEQDDFNSIIGRVGFGIGQRTDKASYYAKLALAHEFGGDFDTHYTAEETKGTSISFGDTWYEMQLGGTAKLSDNSLLYATYERSFGGDVTEKWRVDAGLRVTF